MKNWHKIGAGVAIAGALALAACTDAQLARINVALDKYDAAVVNFNAAVARINTSIVLTSRTVANYCDDAKSVGSSITTIVSGNDHALTALNALTEGLNSYCAAPPQDVGAAADALADIIAKAAAVYQAEKK